MDPQDEKKIDLRVADQLQKFTGTPPQQLRGLTVQSALDDFVSRSINSQVETITPPDSTIKSSIVATQPDNPMTVEQPSILPVGGTSGSSVTVRAVVIVSGTPTATTQDVLIP